LGAFCRRMAERPESLVIATGHAKAGLWVAGHGRRGGQSKGRAKKSQADLLKVVNEAHTRNPLGTAALAVKPGPRTGESMPARRGKAGTRLSSTGCDLFLAGWTYRWVSGVRLCGTLTPVRKWTGTAATSGASCCPASGPLDNKTAPRSTLHQGVGTWERGRSAQRITESPERTQGRKS
jgi:hypothetical protein